MTLIKEMKKITTNFDSTDDSDVIGKTYLDEKIFKKTITYHN